MVEQILPASPPPQVIVPYIHINIPIIPISMEIFPENGKFSKICFFRGKFSQLTVNFPKFLIFMVNLPKISFFHGKFLNMVKYYHGISDKMTHTFMGLFPHAMNKAAQPDLGKFPIKV
jgi:hypothetical protein